MTNDQFPMPRALLFLFLVIGHWSLVIPTSFGIEISGLRIPEGFEVVEWADSDLANDIHCLTVGPAGQVVVSGRGYVRQLVDERGTGKATRALDFAYAPRDGAMGLCWDGDDLYCMGDGGLRRYAQASGEGRTRPSELLYPLKTGGEHMAHAIVRGPDGWLYVLGGDGTGFSRKEASLPTSPVQEPVGGCVVRFRPDFRGSEIVADGFRNAYSMDFNSHGELFTFDSDNERCVSLPWYEPTRFYHVVAGSRHGWQAHQLAQTWRLPPYFLDVVAPVAYLDRGSPTGVVCYRHVQFPPRYRDGFFLLDWTFGRIWFLKLERSGATYSAQREVFLQATGEDGFAPTAAAVDPLNGDLYLSIGGRGTRGAVYRIRYPQGMKSLRIEEAARLQPARCSLEWDPDKIGVETLTREASTGVPAERLRALQLLHRHHDRLLKLGHSTSLERAIAANLEQTDRLLRQTTARLMSDLPRETQQRLSEQAKSPPSRLMVSLASPHRQVGEDNRALLLELIADRSLSASLRLNAVRLLQLHLGDIGDPRKKGTLWEGYTLRKPRPDAWERLCKVLRDVFPSGQLDLDRELLRSLALLEDDDAELPGRVAARLTSESHPTEDFHVLTVLARLRGTLTEAVIQQIARALLRLDGKITARKMNRERHWDVRLSELAAELIRRQPNLNQAMLEDPEFGRADHGVFAEALRTGQDRAAERFLARAERERDFAWNPALIGLVAGLAEERSLPVLRRLWGQAGQDEAILEVLARKPRIEDRDRFVESLKSGRMQTVAASVQALSHLRVPLTRDEVLALVLALRGLPPGKEGDPVRQHLLPLLKLQTRQDLNDADAWSKWVAQTWPDFAPRVRNLDGVDESAWERRLLNIDWSQGNAESGKQVFVRAQCNGCHSGAQALGPDLKGVAGRFSRSDLFTAILQPSKDVPPRYRTTILTTTSGKSYQGMIVYEAADSVILQTGPLTTVRLTDTQISERLLSTRSLMPSGLLDRISDREIADLYAFLKELK